MKYRYYLLVFKDYMGVVRHKVKQRYLLYKMV